jgi:hypothetical protein
VTVALGAAPAAPTTVALANGGGVGNAYINNANKGSLNVSVGLPASSVSTNTVHVTITDGTNTTTDQTTAATNGAGTVTVTGINATSLSDGSVTIQATSSNGSGTSPMTTTSVTKDTVKPTSAAGTVANITSGNTFAVPYTSGDTSPSSSLEKVELYVDTPGAPATFSLTNTDSDPSASGESFSYTGATTDGTYGFYTRAYDNAGNVEDAPGAADATATRTTVTTFRMATGTYTGNNVDGRAISAPGFQPDVVIVKGGSNASAAVPAVMRTSGMTGDNAKPLVGTTALTANLIESLTASGFTLGNASNGLNATGVTYNWVAFQAGAGSLSVGSYAGNNGSSQAITGIGFQPEYVAVLSAAGNRAVQRFTGMTSSFRFDADTGAANRISSLDADGFTVADGAEANDTGTYHYVAFNEVAGSIDTGTYTGNASADRSITSVGFQPEYVAVRSSKTTSSGTEGNHRPASLLGDASQQFDGGSNGANVTASPFGIRGLTADGFRVGSNAAVNENTTSYHYIAFRNTGGGCGLPGTYTLAPTADSWVNQTSTSQNNGTDSNLKVTSKSSNSNTRALVQFQSLLPTLPSGCTVTDAQLRLRNKSPVSGRTIEAYRVGAPWTETGVNWTNQPATVDTAATAVTPSSAGFMTWSVASMVEEGVQNGFLLRDQTENDSGGKEQQFDSREASASDRPQLIVTLGN